MKTLLDVTAIVTVWKRNQINEQINSILEGSAIPSQIWIYHCCEFVKPEIDFDNCATEIRYIFFSFNAGYYGRFSVPLLASTRFIWIIDDDVIPSSDWLSYVYHRCLEKNAIICSSGRIIPKNNFKPEQYTDGNYTSEYFIGDGEPGYTNYCSKETVVDYGCNNWFFERNWLSAFWSIMPYNLRTAEDIHFSAMCKLVWGINTIVPKQQENDLCGNTKKYYGFDEFASWRKADFIHEREEHLKYLIREKGWSPLLWN